MVFKTFKNREHRGFVDRTAKASKNSVKSKAKCSFLDLQTNRYQMRFFFVALFNFLPKLMCTLLRNRCNNIR